uniref:Uncharacterized protein n=1 Tax=mine drainage metagenome TaxID=410659 RepID=E6PUZ3_9ZZZZ
MAVRTPERHPAQPRELSDALPRPGIPQTWVVRIFRHAIQSIADSCNLKYPMVTCPGANQNSAIEIRQSFTSICQVCGFCHPSADSGAQRVKTWHAPFMALVGALVIGLSCGQAEAAAETAIDAQSSGPSILASPHAPGSMGRMTRALSNLEMSSHYWAGAL